MADNTSSVHEAAAQLQPATLERHRAVASLIEELQAIDWYDQRIDATADAQLRALLIHNRDEEKEHAALTLEWLRRHDPQLDAQLRQYLFKGESTAEAATGDEQPPAHADASRQEGCLAIGSLRSTATQRGRR